MLTLSPIKLKIMIRAFKIRIANGESFDDIAADYTALSKADIDTIRAALD